MFNILEFHLDPESYVPLMDHITEEYIHLRLDSRSLTLSDRLFYDFTAMCFEKFLLESGFSNILSSLCSAYAVEPLWVEYERSGLAGTSFFK